MLKRFLETLNEAEEVRSLYAFQGMDDDVESVYAFDTANKKYPTDWHEFEGCHCGDLTDYAMDTSADNSDDIETCSPQAFWPSVLFSIWAYLQFVKANWYHLDNEKDIASEEGNWDSTATNPQINTLKTNETDEDIYSVYAFDADDSETLSIDVNEDTDDVASVYAFDFAPNDNETYSADASKESASSESSNTFGFTVPNLGEDEQYGYHADSEDGRFDFYNDNVACVRLVTGESLTLVFNGQNLKVVIHDGKVYTSFDAMPSKIANILITAREAIIGLVF